MSTTRILPSLTGPKPWPPPSYSRHDGDDSSAIRSRRPPGCRQRGWSVPAIPPGHRGMSSYAVGIGWQLLAGRQALLNLLESRQCPAQVLPISSVLDQGAALRAARAVSRPAASRPGRLRHRGGEPPTTAGPPPRTPLMQTQHDHGQAARKPAGRPDRGSGLPTAAPVQPQDWLAAGLPPRPGKPAAASTGAPGAITPGRQLLEHGRSQVPEEH